MEGNFLIHSLSLFAMIQPLINFLQLFAERLPQWKVQVPLILGLVAWTVLLSVATWQAQHSSDSPMIVWVDNLPADSFPGDSTPANFQPPPKSSPPVQSPSPPPFNPNRNSITPDLVGIGVGTATATVAAIAGAPILVFVGIGAATWLLFRTALSK